MNRTKRITSCPNLSSKSSRTRDRELANTDVLRKIQKQYELCAPLLLGHPIKLADLFTAVVVRGGYRSVCDKRLWSDVAEELSLPSSCTNSAVGLRCIYHRFLIKFELDEYPNLVKNYLTQLYSEFSPDPIEKELPFIPANSIERNLGISHSDAYGTPSLHSNYHSLVDLRIPQNIQDVPRLNTSFDKLYPNALDPACDSDQLSAIARSCLNDPLRLRDPTELVLVELALSSGLPNEVDCALNSLLILSTTPCPSTGSSTSIRLPQCRNLLNAILATVGIYTDGLGSFDICDPDWRDQTHMDFLRFWHNMVHEPRGRLFLRPDVFINPDPDDEPSTYSSANWTELFAPPMSTSHRYRSTVTEEAEASRVFLVATLLVNLVTPSPLQSNKYSEDDFDDYDCEMAAHRSSSLDLSPLPACRENSQFLASSPTALRFAFLCGYAHHSSLRQLGLQLLSSLRYLLDPPSSYSMSVACPTEWTPLVDFGCRLGHLTLSFINHCVLDSPDRTSLLGGLHFLSNLATVPEKANEPSLLARLHPVIWPRLAQLLCLPDLAVVCATLEALRCLTNLGQCVCAFAWEACLEWSDSMGTVPLILLQPLLALLTLEGQAMGSRSLHRIKIMPRALRTTLPSAHPLVQQRTAYFGAPHPTEWHRVSAYSKNLSFNECCPHPTSPPVYPSSPHQQTDFSSRSMNALHLRPRVSGPAKLPTHISQSPISIPEITPTPVRPSGSIQRPPSSSTNCTGLINLLASLDPPSSALTSNSSIPTQSASCSTASGNLPPSCPPSPLHITTSSSKTSGSHSPSPSLSELTDRLQMPPPSLPPPSALRRSAKSSLSRCSLTSSSPTSRSTIPLPSSTTHSATTTCAPPIISDSFIKSSTNPSMLSSNNGEKTYCNVTTVASDPSEPAKFFTSQSRTDSTLKSTEQRDSRTPAHHCTLSSGFHRSTKLDDKLHLPNGSLMIGIRSETKLEAGHEYLRPKKDSTLFLTSSRVNGLRPGILQAAVDALDESKLDKLSKYANNQESLVNGFLAESNTCGTVLKFKNDISSSLTKSPSGVESTERVRLNGIAKSLPVSAMNGHTKGNEVIFSGACATASPAISSCKDSSTCSATSLTNGTNDGSDSGGSSSGGSSESSGNETSPESLRHSSTSHNRFLKRRRKWGSRSRLFNPKRKRVHTLSDPQADQCTVSLSPPSVDKDSLLKQPLNLRPLPDSVLAPNWKSPLSPVSPVGTGNSFISKVTPPDSDNTTSSNSGRRTESSQPCESPSDSFPAPVSEVPRTPAQERISHRYVCEWENCHACFDKKAYVATHVYQIHLATLDRTNKDGTHAIRRCCHWRDCLSSSLARAPFALLTHVLDVHCNPAELEARKHMTSSIPPASPICDVYQVGKHPAAWNHPEPSAVQSQHGHLVYPVDPNALSHGDQSAWSIVRSLEMRQMQHDMWAAHYHLVSANPLIRLPFIAPSHLSLSPPPREGPVTKHLRVTAALVLRNFVLYLNEAKDWFASELPLLSEIALGCSPSDSGLKTNDAGSIVAQCFALCSRVGGSSTQQPLSCSLSNPPPSYHPKPAALVVPRYPPSSDQHRRCTSLQLQSPTHTVDLDAKST
ncbi:unnamed protein product [Dicrocoelium dendriticum]|nr:unnamed protein product [Dicrocoelium dendriticum]